MFTGIVETTAAVTEKTDHGLTIKRPTMFNDIAVGSSIAVNGVCLSVVEFTNELMRFSIVEETWNKTNLGDLTVGTEVNLERSMGARSRFEGHIVQGHVEGTAPVESFTTQDDGSGWLTILLPDTLRPFVLEKGSIALNGISLTVAKLEGNACTIALIPHTLSVTTCKDLREGMRINVETDILGRYALSAQQHS